MKKNTAIYARVSSEQQVTNKTIQSQIMLLLERINSDGLTIQEQFQFIDDGYSGTTLRRPALERLRDTVSSGMINRIYFQSPDRLSRKFAHQILLLEEFSRATVDVVFLNRQLGESPEDQLLLHIQGIVAEYERAKILERARRGKLYAAKRGSVAALGSAPYGYKYCAKKFARNGEAQYKIISKEAKVVRQIFEWISKERISISEVCRRLESSGIKTRSENNSWGHKTVWGILRNPAYAGLAAFGKTRTGPKRVATRFTNRTPSKRRMECSVYAVPPENWIYIPCPRIISPALYKAVQKQLDEERMTKRVRKSGARFLLQGLIKCKNCGHSFYGKAIRSSEKYRWYVYYRCVGSDSYRTRGEPVCPYKQIRQEIIETAVWSKLADLLRHPEQLEESVRASGALETTRLQMLIEKLKEFASQIGSLMDNTDWQSKRTLLKELVDRIEVTPQSFNIIFRIDHSTVIATRAARGLTLRDNDSFQISLTRIAPKTMRRR